MGGAAAAGLDGLLNEWVWTQRTPAVGMDSYGGPVWGLATEPAAALDAEVQEQRVAAACDDGTVRPHTTSFRVLHCASASCNRSFMDEFHPWIDRCDGWCAPPALGVSPARMREMCSGSRCCASPNASVRQSVQSTR